MINKRCNYRLYYLFHWIVQYVPNLKSKHELLLEQEKNIISVYLIIASGIGSYHLKDFAYKDRAPTLNWF